MLEVAKNVFRLKDDLFVIKFASPLNPRIRPSACRPRRRKIPRAAPPISLSVPVTTTSTVISSSSTTVAAVAAAVTSEAADAVAMVDSTIDLTSVDTGRNDEGKDDASHTMAHPPQEEEEGGVVVVEMNGCDDDAVAEVPSVESNNDVSASEVVLALASDATGASAVTEGGDVGRVDPAAADDDVADAGDDDADDVGDDDDDNDDENEEEAPRHDEVEEGEEDEEFEQDGADEEEGVDVDEKGDEERDNEEDEASASVEGSAVDATSVAATASVSNDHDDEEEEVEEDEEDDEEEEDDEDEDDEEDEEDEEEEETINGCDEALLAPDLPKCPTGQYHSYLLTIAANHSYLPQLPISNRDNYFITTTSITLLLLKPLVLQT